MTSILRSIARTPSILRWHGRKLLKKLLLLVSKTHRRQLEMETLVGPIGYWDELSTYQADFLKRMGLQPNHRLLDLGCGPLQAGIPCIDYLDKQRYVGIDIRPRPLEVAHERVSEHHLAHQNPLLLHSETFGAHELPGATFDFIWVSQMLYHLDADHLSAMLAQVARFMGPDSFLYGDIMVDDPAHGWLKRERDWQGFRYWLRTPNDIVNACKEHGLTARDIGPLSEYGYPEQVSLRTNRMMEIRLKAP